MIHDDTELRFGHHPNPYSIPHLTLLTPALQPELRTRIRIRVQTRTPVLLLSPSLRFLAFAPILAPSPILPLDLPLPPTHLYPNPPPLTAHLHLTRILKQIETYYSREGLIVEIPADTGPEDFETLLKAT